MHEKEAHVPEERPPGLTAFRPRSGWVRKWTKTLTFCSRGLKENNTGSLERWPMARDTHCTLVQFLRSLIQPILFQGLLGVSHILGARHAAVHRTPRISVIWESKFCQGRQPISEQGNKYHVCQRCMLGSKRHRSEGRRGRKHQANEREGVEGALEVTGHRGDTAGPPLRQGGWRLVFMRPSATGSY